MANEEVKGMVVQVGITDDLFTQGIGKIDKAMKLLQSEFKVSSEALKGFGSSTDALANRGDYLSKAIELQKAKIQQLKDAYEKAKTETGAYSDATQNAGTKVNNAVAYLTKMQNELKNVDSELIKTNAEEKKLSLSEGINKLSSNVEGAKSKIMSFKTAIAGITAALAGGFGLVKFTEGAIEAGDKAYTLSQKMHLSTTEATQLNRILSITNTDTKPLISTITNLDKAIGKAGVTEDKNNQKLQETINKNKDKIATLEKSKKITDEVRKKIQGLKDENEDYSAELKANQEAVGANSATLQKYGINLTDAQGKFLPITEQLQRLSDAYKKSSDAGNEEAFVADVLGAKGAQLVPLLEQYTEAKEEASKVKGIGIDPKQAHETEEQLKVLKMQVAATGGVMAKSLIPLVQAILPPLIVLFQKLTEQIKTHKADLDVFIKNIVDIGKSIGTVLIPIVTTLFNFIINHGQAAKLIIVAIGTSFLGLQTVVGTLKTVNNAVTTFKDSMDNAKKAADLLKTGVGFLGDGFNVIKGAISGGIEAVVSFGKATGEALISVGKMTIELATQAGSWIAQKVALVASTIATGAMTVAQGALNLIMAMNPISLVVIGITALVAALIVAYNKSEWFRDGVNKAFTAIKETAIWAFNGIKDFLVNWGSIILIPVAPFLGIPLTIMQHWNQIKDFFSNLGAWLKQKLHDMFNFELPHIKLPHLSIDGSFSIAPPSVPSIGVKWYSDGAIFNKRTILGGIGVGDRNHGSGDNPEVVAPLDLLLKHIDKIGQNGNMPSEITLNFNNYMDGKYFGRQTAKYVDAENGWQLI